MATLWQWSESLLSLLMAIASSDFVIECKAPRGHCWESAVCESLFLADVFNVSVYVRYPERVCWHCTGPTNFGPTAEAATPWVQLAMYTAMRAGPLSVVLVCGQRLWRLPPQLLGCTHCLIWPWDTEAVRAHVRPTSCLLQPWHL